MISPARRTAYKLLIRIIAGKTFSDDALHSTSVERLEVRDRHLTTELVYGTLRLQGTLDYVLKDFSSIPWAKVDPGVRTLLQMSLYQMWRMDRIPDHALVNDAVELAKRELGRGIERFINAVLRKLTRTRPWENRGFLDNAPPWVRVSLPQWLWERWAERFGEQAAHDYAASLTLPPQPTVRLNGKEGGAIASDLVPGAGILKDKPEIDAFRFQDEASQLIPHLFGPTEGWRIWDACAAPGGKTAILQSMCGAAGRVTASDWRHDRVLRLIKLLGASGRKPPDTLVLDAGNSVPFRRCFDAVLADAPCSGLGTLRRNPEIKWRIRPEGLTLLQRNQIRILESVSESVKVGGLLLYSTCSTEPEENEQVIGSFMKDHPEFICQSPVHPAGIDGWTGKDSFVRTFPSTRLWDGFFAALMVRKGRSSRD